MRSLGGASSTAGRRDHLRHLRRAGLLPPSRTSSTTPGGRWWARPRSPGSSSSGGVITPVGTCLHRDDRYRLLASARDRHRRAPLAALPGYAAAVFSTSSGTAPPSSPPPSTSRSSSSSCRWVPLRRGLPRDGDRSRRRRGQIIRANLQGRGPRHRHPRGVRTRRLGLRHLQPRWGPAAPSAHRRPRLRPPALSKWHAERALGVASGAPLATFTVPSARERSAPPARSSRGPVAQHPYGYPPTQYPQQPDNPYPCPARPPRW